MLFRSLDLSGMQLTHHGAAKAAAFCTEHRSVTALSLRANSIGDEGARALAKLLARPDCCIASLNVNGNSIFADGAMALSEALAVKCVLCASDW